MLKVLKRIFWLVVLIVILCGVGYGLYWYFNQHGQELVVDNIARHEEISKEYLDTLVVGVNNSLANIETQVGAISHSFKTGTFLFTVLSLFVLFNLILTVILCLLVRNLSSKIKKISNQNHNN